ncbi:MAG: GNAT family N-acetyltransferase [Thermoleophilia bacterium]
MDSSLRRFRVETDLAEAVALSRHALARETEQVGRPLWTSRADADAELEDKDWPGETLIVAEDDGRLAAIGGLDPNALPGVFGPLVAPDARGRKLGTVLLEATIELARERGMGTLTASVGARNAAGRMLLERYGFHRAEKPDAVYRLFPGALLPHEDGPSGLSIRGGTADDLDALLTLYRATFPTARRTPETWRRWIVSGEVYIAELDGHMAAFVHIGHGWMTHVGVSEEDRGRGLGEAITSRVLEAYWRERPEQELRLTVKTDNLPAIRLYRRLGFAPWIVLDPFDLAL